MQKSKGFLHQWSIKALWSYQLLARLHKIGRLGSDSEAGESVEDKEEAGEDEEDKEPEAGGLGDDGDGDGDMEGPLYPALAVVQL